MPYRRSTSVEENGPWSSKKKKDFYCLCETKKEDIWVDAKWIACDNPKGCPVEWYHLACVELTDDTIPQGDWLCPRCTKSKKKRKALYVCEICDQEFNSKEACVAHKLEHNSIGSGQSNVMKQTTNQNTAYKQDDYIQEVGYPGCQHPSDITSDVLQHYTNEDIIQELVKRGQLFHCDCGVIFEEESVYNLHRVSHDKDNTMKCARCDFEAKNWLEFTHHFIVHNQSQRK